MFWGNRQHSRQRRDRLCGNRDTFKTRSDSKTIILTDGRKIEYHPSYKDFNWITEIYAYDKYIKPIKNIPIVTIDTMCDCTN